MYNLKVAIFDENMAVGKSKYLVTLYLYELRQPWFEGVLWFWPDFYWLCSFKFHLVDLKMTWYGEKIMNGEKWDQFFIKTPWFWDLEEVTDQKSVRLADYRVDWQCKQQIMSEKRYHR